MIWLILASLASSAACYGIGRSEGAKSKYAQILAHYRKSPKDLFEQLEYDAALPPGNQPITDY